jgi:mannobiose 2-epimerase
LARLAREARAELDRIVDWWAAKAPDRNGGFVGEISADGAALPDADKAVVLNLRLLWFFSSAYARSGSPACRELAQRAADYVADRFVDPRHGGLYWMLDAQGRPLDQRKLAYAQAFGVYAFAAHFDATGAQASLAGALGLYDVLERHFRDEQWGGYWDARAEDFSAVDDMRLSARDLNAAKSMNAHLHVLEAYAALLRVHPRTGVARALENVFDIMIEKVRDFESGRLRAYFDRDWRSIGRGVSFGHDIEASWLLCDAADALDQDGARARAKAAALSMVEATLATGFGPDGEIYEARDGDGRISQRRVWWIQAEGLIALLNAFELTGDGDYVDACDRLWRFIQAHQIDRDGGEWRASSALDPPADPPEPQAGPWKCPYHTGRAMLEMERRARALARASADEVEVGT